MAGLALLKGYSYLFNRRHRPPMIDEMDDVFADPQLEPDTGAGGTRVRISVKSWLVRCSNSPCLCQVLS